MGEDVKLLPCPFCGGEAHYSERMDEDIATHDTVLWKRISCFENDCAAIEWPDGYEGGTAVERWNTRVSHKEGENG